MSGILCRGLQFLDQAHNLKVTGSNPVPATKFARQLKRLAGVLLWCRFLVASLEAPWKQSSWHLQRAPGSISTTMSTRVGRLVSVLRSQKNAKLAGIDIESPGSNLDAVNTPHWFLRAATISHRGNGVCGAESGVAATGPRGGKIDLQWCMATGYKGRVTVSASTTPCRSLPLGILVRLRVERRSGLLRRSRP